MTLRVRVLGGLAVEGVNLARLSSRKARRVLGCLVVARGAPITADVLTARVWPDDRPSQPADQLAVLISRLRSVVGADRLARGPAGYTLTVDWLDVIALAELTAEARRRLDLGAVAPARAAARAALDLLRGPVLPEEPPDADWLEVDRAEATRVGAAARLVAAEAALAAGDAWAAIELAERAWELEPYDEAALRTLMSAHAGAGRPALALRAYATAARRLRDELGVDPAPATSELHRRLLRAETPPPAVAPVPAPLPGRAAELAQLGAALAAAGRGEAQLVVLDGEAGIGKTRLLERFRAGLTGAVVLTCRADERSGGLPLQCLLDALASHRAATGDLFEGAAEPLRPLLLGGSPAAGPSPMTALADPELGLSLMFAAVDAVITRLAAAGGPVVLTVDDVQWADPATRAWLHHALHRLASVRLLLVAARRSGEGEPVYGDVIRLGVLDRAAAADAVGLPADSPEAQRLYERSGGHPLFLSELARSGEGELPASIRDAIVDRCDRAGPAVAATLRAAAVLGGEIDLELLAAVLHEPVAALLDHLEDGARRHLLAESGAGFVFAHELVRDALRTGTGAARALLLHRAAARVLAIRLTTDPLAVAYHARLGDDPAMAATALAQAGEIAAGRYDLAEAGRLLDQAVALHDRPDLRLRRARIRLRRTDTSGATVDVNDARERLGGDDPDYPAALEVAALIAYLERDFDRCRRLAEEGAAMATDGEVRASCRALAGRVRHAVGDLPEASALLAGLADEAPASIAPIVGTWHGFLLVHRDEPARALPLVATPEPGQARVGYPFSPTSRHMVAGYARALLGEPAQALREFDLMTEAARQQATHRFSGRDDNFRGWVLRSVGAFGEADDANLRAYEDSRSHNLPEPLAHALLDLADGRLRAGDVDGAHSYVERIATEVVGSYLFQWRTELRCDLVAGRCALAGGDPDRAAECFTSVRETAERLGLRRYLVLSRLWLGLAQRPDPSALASDVDDLGRLAPLEAWWLTAELARAFDVDAWRRLADDRAYALAGRAGRYAAGLRQAATRNPA